MNHNPNPVWVVGITNTHTRLLHNPWAAPLLLWAAHFLSAVINCTCCLIRAPSAVLPLKWWVLLPTLSPLLMWEKGATEKNVAWDCYLSAHNFYWLEGYLKECSGTRGQSHSHSAVNPPTAKLCIDLFGFLQMHQPLYNETATLMFSSPPVDIKGVAFRRRALGSTSNVQCFSHTHDGSAESLKDVKEGK